MGVSGALLLEKKVEARTASFPHKSGQCFPEFESKAHESLERAVPHMDLAVGCRRRGGSAEGLICREGSGLDP